MFLLHCHFVSGLSRTLTFTSAFERGLMIITLAALPVVLQLEDRRAA
jgi:hypothetical protein